VEPRVALKGRILSLADPLALEELFGSDELDHLRRVARLKVIGVFRIAGEISVAMVEPPSGLEYCLSGMDGSLDQLAATIARNMKGSHSFVKPGDLLPAYRDLAEHWRNTVRAHARHLLLLEVVTELELRHVKLWYHSGERRWQAAQSLIDEHERLLREVKRRPEPRPELPYNRRPWHGRPARDRRRAVMPGTSVGYAA